MEIDLLGTFAVRRGGRTVGAGEYGGRRVRQLIRILAADRGAVVTRDQLIDALWGEQLPADPATNLNVVVNRARRALDEPELIRTAGGGYLLRDGPDVTVDSEQFEAAVEEARSSLGRDAVSAFSRAVEALGRWGEPLAEDAYADWARPHRDRLERLHQEALEIAAAAGVVIGRAREAVDLAARAVARQPLREAAHLLLVEAYAADGDQAAAIASYLDLRKVLADELGIDPSPAAAATYERILQGGRPAAATARPRRRGGEAPPLVGRDAELEQLSSLGADQRVAVVSARSGWGKTRLLDALSERLDRPVLAARGLLPERDEPWSLVRTLLRTSPAQDVDVGAMLGAPTLAALRDVLPDIDIDNDVAGPPADARSRRALVQQGVVQVLEATAPSAILVDDLQWADSSSLDALALLIDRDADVVVVLAYRPEEVAEDSPVARLLSSVADLQPVDVALAPLDPSALERLVTSPPMAAALAAHTDRTPFAVLQAVRMLEREGLLRRSSSGSWEAVAEPDAERAGEVARTGQRAAVWRLYERQDQAARELLATLALLGRPSPVRVLAAGTGLSVDRGLQALRDLARAHLVQHDAAGFRVAHDLVGETVRDRLDPVARARLHQQIAGVLAAEDGPSDELARHLSGAGDRTAAAAAYADAARARLDRFADSEAHRLADEGLALDPSDDLRARLLEVRGETHARRGDPATARRDLRAALALGTSGAARSRLLTRLAALTAGAEDMMRAAELAELAVAEAGDAPAARARALHGQALVDMNLGRAETADARFAEALELFTSVGDSAGMADILDARAMTVFGNGDITTGMEEFDRVAKLFADHGNLLRVVTPRSTRGHGLLFAARPEEALADCDEALEIARSLGYAEGQAMAHWHHAEALVGCGRAEEGLAGAERGLQIARDLGHRGWTATNLRAIGVARVALGDLDAAADAFEQSLSVSGEHLVMFAAWARARLALVHLMRDDLEAAASYVDDGAARPGPGLQRYETRLARCELAVRRGNPDAPALVRSALHHARAGGHLASAIRLAQLQTQLETPLGTQLETEPAGPATDGGAEPARS